MRKRLATLSAIVLTLAICLAPGLASPADLTLSADASRSDAGWCE